MAAHIEGGLMEGARNDPERSTTLAKAGQLATKRWVLGSSRANSVDLELLEYGSCTVLQQRINCPANGVTVREREFGLTF